MAEAARFVLWGSAGHAMVLAGLIALRGGTVTCLFDNNPQALSVLPGVPLYIGKAGYDGWLKEQRKPGQYLGLAAIGGSRGADRLAIQELFSVSGIDVEAIVHPDASVCRTASLGAGTQVLAQAVVAADVRTGPACIVNHAATIDHECDIGAGTHVAPGATLCGGVVLGRNVMIGAGAVILPRITVGQNTIVGAGAVVTRNLPENVIAIGNPAKIVQDSESANRTRST